MFNPCLNNPTLTLIVLIILDFAKVLEKVVSSQLRLFKNLNLEVSPVRSGVGGESPLSVHRGGA